MAKTPEQLDKVIEFVRNDWPRIKDLPIEEQEPFREWLQGQTCPVIEDVPFEESDGYYDHNYKRWKAGIRK